MWTMKAMEQSMGKHGRSIGWAIWVELLNQKGSLDKTLKKLLLKWIKNNHLFWEDKQLKLASTCLLFAWLKTLRVLFKDRPSMPPSMQGSEEKLEKCKIKINQEIFQEFLMKSLPLWPKKTLKQTTANQDHQKALQLTKEQGYLFTNTNSSLLKLVLIIKYW